MSTANVYDFESPRKEISRAPLCVPKKSCENPCKSLHPLVLAKYYDSPGKQLFFHFISDFLQVSILGFQSGFGFGPDLILFNDPIYRTTLCVPTSVMLEPMERAREIVQQKIQEKQRAFGAAHQPEAGEIFAYA